MRSNESNQRDKHNRDWCTMFPESVLGVCIAECCKAHDKAYARGGSKFDRRVADRVLKTCMRQRLRRGNLKAPGIIKSLVRKILPYCVYIAVRVGGAGRFYK